MTTRLNLPFPTRESLQEVWEGQLRSGELFLPTSADVAVGEQLILSISAPDAPSSLDLLGTVTDHVELAGMSGLQVRFELGERESAAVDAYAAGYWQEAFVLLGVPSGSGEVDRLIDEPEPLPHGYADRPTPVQMAVTDEYPKEAIRKGSSPSVSVHGLHDLKRSGKTKTADYEWPPPKGALDDGASHVGEEEIAVEMGAVEEESEVPSGAMIRRKRRPRRDTPAPAHESAKAKPRPAELESAFIEILTAHAKMEARDELQQGGRPGSSGARQAMERRATPPPAGKTGPRAGRDRASSGSRTARDSEDRRPRDSSPRNVRRAGAQHAADSDNDRSPPPPPASRPRHSGAVLEGSTPHRVTPDPPIRRGIRPARESGAFGHRVKSPAQRRGKPARGSDASDDEQRAGPIVDGPPAPAPSRQALRNLRESGGKTGRSSDGARERRRKKDSDD